MFSRFTYYLRKRDNVPLRPTRRGFLGYILCKLYMHNYVLWYGYYGYGYGANTFVLIGFQNTIQLVDGWGSRTPGEAFSVHRDISHLACKSAGVTMFGDYFQNDEHVDEFIDLYWKVGLFFCNTSNNGTMTTMAQSGLKGPGFDYLMTTGPPTVFRVRL